jgi:spore germination protein KA
MPAFFISVTEFHNEMLPTEFALNIAKSGMGVALPTFLQVLAMLVSFEILFEASLRIPRSIGNAVSIIGTLVIGQQAVDSKIVSSTVVLIIAFTAVSSFVMPNQDFSNALRIWRFIFATLSSIAGLFGLGIGVIIFVHHLAKLESFGVPYLSPLVSSEWGDLFKDTFFRFPIKFNKTRPANLKAINKKRQGN